VSATNKLAHRTFRHDPVEPSLERARRPEVVEREPDQDCVSGQDFIDELGAKRDCGCLLGGAIWLRDELCEEGHVAFVLVTSSL
jgi:hypothetical protein